MQQDHANLARRNFIGGSDARIIMGQDEKALIRLWQEKRGEVEPEDLSGNLIVQLGLVTEGLNRQWYERNTGNAIPPSTSKMAAVKVCICSALGSAVSRMVMMPAPCYRFSREGQW
jgi:predicted phage-related endonuclease